VAFSINRVFKRGTEAPLEVCEGVICRAVANVLTRVLWFCLLLDNFVKNALVGKKLIGCLHLLPTMLPTLFQMAV
jgi:hypothetical protein